MTWSDEQEVFIKKNVKEFCDTLLRLLDNDVPVKDIREELTAMFENKLAADPKNTNLYGAAILRFSKIVSVSLENTENNTNPKEK